LKKELSEILKEINVNVVVTEYYFLFACPYYIDIYLNTTALGQMYKKFKMLVNTSQQNVIKKLSNIIYYAILARETTGI
jgi:hypothetical protein